MLTEAELVAARRFCGYPVRGAGGNPGGWYYYPAYGMLEYRLANLAASEEAVVRQYLATLGALEAAVPGTADGLGVAQAGDYRRNPSELLERIGLLDDWARRLRAFLGVPAGPGVHTQTACVI